MMYRRFGVMEESPSRKGARRKWTVVAAGVVGAALVLAAIAVLALRERARPMMLCITFDDGLKTHAEIAGPMLAARGWSGAFNLPTDFVADHPEHLTPEAIETLFLQGNEENRMTWADAKELVANGHEVYPHTWTHRNLADLARSGRFSEVKDEVAKSARDVADRLGAWPAFFCYPYNASTPETDAVIRGCDMEPMEVFRLNFGSDTPSDGGPKSVTARMRAAYLAGEPEQAIMVHGIVAARGGWKPFETRETFAAFLDEIAALERDGIVRVTPYSRAYPPRASRFGRLAEKCRHALLKRFRRCVLSVANPPRQRPVRNPEQG